MSGPAPQAPSSRFECRRLFELRAWLTSSTGWHRRGLAFAAGAFSVLALAPFFFWPVLFLTLPVLVWLIDGSAAGVTAAMASSRRFPREAENPPPRSSSGLSRGPKAQQAQPLRNVTSASAPAVTTSGTLDPRDKPENDKMEGDRSNVVCPSCRHPRLSLHPSPSPWWGRARGGRTPSCRTSRRSPHPSPSPWWGAGARGGRAPGAVGAVCSQR